MFKRFIKSKKTRYISGGILIGILLLVGVEKGMAYMDSPEFCSSCHIMEPVTASFEESTHSNLDCNDCHMPEGNLISHAIFKAKVGSGHFYYNTFAEEKIPVNIEAKEETKEIIKENCISCHENTVNDVSHQSKEDCVECHVSVAHGTKPHRGVDMDEAPKSGELNQNKGGIY